VFWASKKQNSVALSTTEAEYIAAGYCCAQLLWTRQTLRDYGYKLSKVPLLCDNESAIRMVDNPVEHSRTKHIDICRRFETGGSLSRRVNVAACPSPDGSSAWASAKGGSEVAGDGRERGGNPAAFVFVPRPGRVRLQ
jgi:hypothetical protein